MIPRSVTLGSDAVESEHRSAPPAEEQPPSGKKTQQGLQHQRERQLSSGTQQKRHLSLKDFTSF